MRLFFFFFFSSTDICILYGGNRHVGGCGLEVRCALQISARRVRIPRRRDCFAFSFSLQGFVCFDCFALQAVVFFLFFDLLLFLLLFVYRLFLFCFQVTFSLF